MVELFVDVAKNIDFTDFEPTRTLSRRAPPSVVDGTIMSNFLQRHPEKRFSALPSGPFIYMVAEP